MGTWTRIIAYHPHIFVGVPWCEKATVIAHSYQTYRSKLRILQNGLNIRSWMTFILVASRENIFATSCNTWWNIIRHQNERFWSINKSCMDFWLHDPSKKNRVDQSCTWHSWYGQTNRWSTPPHPGKDRSVLTAYMRRNDPQLWLFCQMEYYCAIRPNELRQLRIQDIDFTRRLIRVPCTISKTDKQNWSICLTNYTMYWLH